MKLLICTQKVDKNDDLLGFFHAWIAEFAKNCDNVTVVCLYMGEVDLPGNVRVLSLGKERATNNIQHITYNKSSKNNLLHVACYMFRKASFRIKYFFRFYKYIWSERKNYDSVFVHMNSIYVLLGGLFWKIWKKKIGLWYAHGHAPWELRIAERIVDNIFTSTAGGCRLVSDKIRIVGQGIDVGRFRSKKLEVRSNEKIANTSFVNPAKAGIQGEKRPSVKLITIGRISPVKDLETLINAVGVLVERGIDVKLDIIGAIGLAKQKKYYDSLLELIKEKKLENRINFVGAVANNIIVEYLQSSDIFVSASQTGSLDKTFLEAMACGLPVIGCNVALDSVLGKNKDNLIYNVGDYLALADKIQSVIDLTEEEYLKMVSELRDVVVSEHGLEGFIKKIIKNY